MRDQLELLTLNIGSPSVERAERQLDWLAGRESDVMVLTETRGTAGTQLIAERLAAAGWAVRCPELERHERGLLIASRVRAHASAEAVVSYLPARAQAVKLAGAEVEVIGVYVPSRDDSPAKTARKQRFVTSLQHAMREPATGMAILLGDLNVLEPDHRPRHPFFLNWEYGLYSGLVDEGWVDAYRLRRPNVIEHTWVDPDGAGFRFDHVFVSAGLRTAVRACKMVHETREEGLSDHSAVTLSLDCGPLERLEVAGTLSREPMALF